MLSISTDDPTEDPREKESSARQGVTTSLGRSQWPWRPRKVSSHGQIFSQKARDPSSYTSQALYPTKATFMRFSGDLGGHHHVALDLSSKESKALGEAQCSCF